jgi:hypothetical protein
MGRANGFQTAEPFVSCFHFQPTAEPCVPEEMDGTENIEVSQEKLQQLGSKVLRVVLNSVQPISYSQLRSKVIGAGDLSDT